MVFNGLFTGTKFVVLPQRCKNWKKSSVDLGSVVTEIDSRKFHVYLVVGLDDLKFLDDGNSSVEFRRDGTYLPP